MTVMVVEDDSKINALLRESLQLAGYSVESVEDGQQALTLAESKDFDVLIVDLMLPSLSGLELISRLRERGIETPCLILSAKVSVAERVEGLRAGGDDYLVKPFALDELLARVEALVRRHRKVLDSSAMRLQYENLTLDLQTREVWRGDVKIDIQVKEFALLEQLMRNADRVLTKEQILKKVWNYDFDPQTNVVDVLIWRLRSKVDRDFQPKLIQTARGVGYVLRRP